MVDNFSKVLRLCYETTKDIYIEDKPIFALFMTVMEKSRSFKEIEYLISKLLQYSEYTIDDIEMMDITYDEEVLSCLIRKENETVDDYAKRARTNRYARKLLLTESNEIWHYLDLVERQDEEDQHRKPIVIYNKTRNLNKHTDLFKVNYTISGILSGLVFSCRDYIKGLHKGLDVNIYDYEKDNITINFFDHDVHRDTRSKYTLDQKIITEIEDLIYDKIIKEGYTYEDPEFGLKQREFDYWPSYKALNFVNSKNDNRRNCFYRISNDYNNTKTKIANYDAPITKQILDVKDEIFNILIENGVDDLIDVNNRCSLVK